MLCSDCPIKDDNRCSDRVFVTIAVPLALYEYLQLHCDQLAKLGFSDRGYKPTVPSLVLHSVAKYANHELFVSPFNVRHDEVHEFDNLMLFKNENYTK